jgi:hypothetical protein
MQFELSALETGTLVFIGTLTLALLITLFVLTAALAVLALVGLGRLAYVVVAGTLLGLVHGINSFWDRLVRRVSRRGCRAISRWTSRLIFKGSRPLVRTLTRG